MSKVIVTAAAGFLVAGTCLVGLPRARSGELKVNGPSLRRKIFGEPMKLKVAMDPGFGAKGEIELVCTTKTYQGECNSKNQNSSLRMAVSGTIEKMGQGRFLISYDLGVRLGDSSGVTRFSAAGSGLLLEGRPTRIVSIGGRSVTMTATIINRNTHVTHVKTTTEPPVSRKGN